MDGFIDSAWNRLDLYLVDLRLAFMPFKFIEGG